MLAGTRFGSSARRGVAFERAWVAGTLQHSARRELVNGVLRGKRVPLGQHRGGASQIALHEERCQASDREFVLGETGDASSMNGRVDAARLGLEEQRAEDSIF